MASEQTLLRETLNVLLSSSDIDFLTRVKNYRTSYDRAEYSYINCSSYAYTYRPTRPKNRDPTCLATRRRNTFLSMYLGYKTRLSEIQLGEKATKKK